MTDVAGAFVLLEARANDVAGSQLLTRPLGARVGSREVLAAVDALRQKHLLIPLRGSFAEGDNASQGVVLGSRVLRVGSDDVSYADLHCRMSSLDLVFERLVEDVLRRLAVDSAAPVTTCRNVLDQWRALLKAASQGVSRETVVGLVGELEVLRLLALHNPTGALDCWRGPSKSVHDFVRDGAELEVKTTTSVDGNFVSISNLDQLDPTLVESLHLVVVHIREDPSAPNLDERIDHLVGIGVPQGALRCKVADAGYVYQSGLEIEDRYRVRSLRAWVVDKSFPGLRRAEMGEARLRGVSKVRYELALDTAPKRIPDDEIETFVKTWVGAE